MLASLRASGRAMPIKDSLIAATALVHHLIVATRNRADFEKAGVGVIDPFAIWIVRLPLATPSSRRTSTAYSGARATGRARVQLAPFQR